MLFMAHPLLHLRILLPFLYNCILCPLLGTIVSQVGISERNVPYPTQLAFEAFESQSPMGKGAMWPNLNVFGFLSCRYAYAHDKKSKEYTERISLLI